jgi:hypothetical protein
MLGFSIEQPSHIGFNPLHSWIFLSIRINIVIYLSVYLLAVSLTQHTWSQEKERWWWMIDCKCIQQETPLLSNWNTDRETDHPDWCPRVLSATSRKFQGSTSQTRRKWFPSTSIPINLYTNHRIIRQYKMYSKLVTALLNLFPSLHE